MKKNELILALRKKKGFKDLIKSNSNLKLFYLFIWLFTTPHLCFSQGCDLPQSIPLNIGELEQANLILAECYAPTIHQICEDDLNNSGEGRADLITSVFYDGDDDGKNNWENLYYYLDQPTLQLDALDPYVYYSVVWLDNYWIITYAFYHPRDYSDDTGCCCSTLPCLGIAGGDNHEHDLEGALIVVDRFSGNIEGTGTISHDDLILYPQFAAHLEVFIDNRTHAVKAYLDLNDCIEVWAADCDGCVPFTKPHVIYNNEPGNSTYVDAQPSITQSQYLSGTGNYKLQDIFGTGPMHLGFGSLDSQRDNQNLFDGDKFVIGLIPGMQHDCQHLGGDASAPWGWGQISYSTQDIFDFLDDLSLINWNNPPAIEYNPYENNPNQIYCTNSNVLTILNNTDWNGLNLVKNCIVVEENKTLTLNNTELKMTAGSRIVLKQGAKLKVENNSIITSELQTNGTHNYWEGIFALEQGTPAQVYINTESKIMNSYFGVSNTVEYDLSWINYPEEAVKQGEIEVFIDGAEFSNNELSLILVDPMKCDVKNSRFIDNEYTINLYNSDSEDALFLGSTFYSNIYSFLTRNSSSKVHIDDCHFEDELFGIDIRNSNDIEVTNSLFETTMQTAITLVESSARIHNNNRFLNNGTGINVPSSYPLSSNIKVGNSETQLNIFDGQDKSLRLFGVNHPEQSLIVNNIFRNDSDYGILLSGDNYVQIVNNDFIGEQVAVSSQNSGFKENNTNCNLFQNNIEQDINIEGLNIASNFLQNQFSGTSSVSNINLIEARIFTPQGIALDPADNCFDNINATDFNVDDLSTSFDYFHFQAPTNANCEIPQNQNNYNPMSTSSNGNHCLEGIGTSGIVESEDDFIHALIPHYDPDDGTCKGCISDSISYYYNLLVSSGGDDPGTEVNENPNQGYQSQILEAKFYYWVRRGILYALVNNDYLFGEQILLPYANWNLMSKLFGIYVKSNQLAKAQTLLNTMPQSDPYQADFKIVQDINISRLSSYPRSIFTPSSQQLSELIRIVADKNVSSGYAWSLYFILTGIELDVEIESSSRARSKLTNNTKSIIYPNPASDILNLNLDLDKVKSISLVNIKGEIIWKGKTRLIDLSTFSSGVYFLNVEMKNDELLHEQVIITKN